MDSLGYGAKLTQESAPTGPVSLTEIKKHLRIDHSDEDTLLSSYITAAREQAEHLTGRAFGERQLKLTTLQGCMQIVLPYPPLVSVDSVNVGGETASYTLDDVEPAVVILDEDPGDEPVTITYTTGSPVPERAKHAIKVLVAHWEQFRTPFINGKVQEVPHTFERLLRTMRIW